MGRVRFLIYPWFIFIFLSVRGRRPLFGQIVFGTLNHATCYVYSPKAVETLIHGKCYVRLLVPFMHAIFFFFFRFYGRVRFEENLNTLRIDVMC